MSVPEPRADETRIDGQKLYEVLQATNVLGGFEDWSKIGSTMQWRFECAAERISAHFGAAAGKAREEK